MPRTYNNLFHQVYDFARLRRSFYAAIKGKLDQNAIAHFSLQLEKNLHRISDELKNGTYAFGPYRSFYVNEPKKRLIESATFQDRVVHHSMRIG